MGIVNKLFIILTVAFIFSIAFASASEPSLGTFKQNTCITLKQTCANCTYNNITFVQAPTSVNALSAVPMTKISTNYNYTFCDTNQIGIYNVNGIGDPNGLDTVWSYTFEITPSGFTDTLGFYFILLLVLIGLIALGFAITDGWFVVFGGAGMIVLGLYSINNGIAGFRDMNLTWAFALTIIGVGAYLAIKSAIEMIDEE